MKSSCGQCYEVKCDDEVTKIRKSFRQNDFIEYNDNFTRFGTKQKRQRSHAGEQFKTQRFLPKSALTTKNGRRRTRISAKKQRVTIEIKYYSFKSSIFVRATTFTADKRFAAEIFLTSTSRSGHSKR